MLEDLQLLSAHTAELDLKSRCLFVTSLLTSPGLGMLYPWCEGICSSNLVSKTLDRCKNWHSLDDNHDVTCGTRLHALVIGPQTHIIKAVTLVYKSQDLYVQFNSVLF
jgi:hypothetical protein